MDAFIRRCICGVATGPSFGNVINFPTGQNTIRPHANMRKLIIPMRDFRFKILRKLHINQIRCNGQHGGCFDIAHVTAYGTDRAHLVGYVAARDLVFQNNAVLPSSTLLIVSGFTKPEFNIAIEVLACAN